MERGSLPAMAGYRLPVGVKVIVSGTRPHKLRTASSPVTPGMRSPIRPTNSMRMAIRP